MIRFYAPQLPQSPLLPAEESSHAIRVLRKRIGDDIEAVDGIGNIYRCRIIGDSSKGAALQILETIPCPKVWNCSITVAVAPTKHMDRMEWLVEKLVEIGVDRIVPLRCRRSERKEIKVERLQKIAVSAMKQSLKAVLPVIDENTPFNDFMKECAMSDALKFVGYCDDSVERRLLAQTYKPGNNVIIMIGPEGDFDPVEINTAGNAGFIPVTMGDNRLRTETAALVACDTVHIVNQVHNL